MRYIGGAVTLAALVFPIIILYKLWSTRRDSTSNDRNNIEDPLSSSVVTSYVMFDSKDSRNNDDDDNIVRETTKSSSSSMIDCEDSNDNIHIAITEQPPCATSPSASHSESSNNINITQQLESTGDHPATPSALLDSAGSTSLPSVEYEVFLSFRGPDTRYQITDILFRFLVRSKIHTFKDDDEMRKGEGIWPSLVKAIRQSKVYVPILSENYAHSKWCLKELAEIVKCCKQDSRRLILPIFYMVDPRDVRHQSGPYGVAFKKYEEMVGEMIDPSDIATWRNALKEIGTLKGWHVKNSKEQAAISDDVSEVIWSHVSKSNVLLDDTVELVGVDDHVNAVVESLSLDDSDESTVMVGIHGAGGIGKTTLATEVYKKISDRFDRCSFLENIRETQHHKDGTLTLQKKLISNILRKDSIVLNDAHEGRKLLRERASQFKILVVLDDVDDSFKFDEVLGNAGKFLPGSRFIATSRDTGVLRRLDREKCRLYEVKYMDSDRSLQLFCKHAFRKDSPPQEFDALSRDIVSTTGGLPLTLKVVGSLLYMEEVSIWKEKLEQLKETTERQVIERLKISYNSLEYEAQQIFLDIACFYIGSDKQIVSYMWADCNFRPAMNIKILIQRSMIKIDDDNRFQMHDQLRDMGRDIVRCENTEIPWKRSRIWSDPVIEEMLRNKMGAHHVKGIRLNHSPPSLLRIKSKGFTNMSEIRYLEASNVHLNGDFSNLLPNLRWLSLPIEFSNRPLERPTNLCMRNLVILDLRSNKFLSNEWDGWHHIKEASRLKVLDISYACHYNHLKAIPEFPKSIEILDLTGFGLSSVGELNIGKLTELHVLKMSRSSIRKIKGGTIGMLSRLRELDVADCECENLQEILANIGELTRLEILRTVGESKGNQVALEGIKHLPTSLKVLSTCSQVPNLSDMLELKTLFVKNCPNGIDNVVQETNYEQWQLHSKLQSLTLEGTKIINHLPTTASLSSLQISGCEELERLPNNLAGLESLTELEVTGCPKLREIRGLGGLKSLVTLTIIDLKGLTHLDISSLLISFNKVQKLTIANCPLLASMTLFSDNNRDIEIVDSLQELWITDCKSLELVGRVLSPQLSKFPKLTFLTLGGFINCEVLTFPAGLEELAALWLADLPSTQVINFLSKLRKLRSLLIRNCHSLREIEGLPECKSLNGLRLVGCTSLEKFEVAGLENLETLLISGGCEVLERPPSLANLPNLRELSLRLFNNLREIGNSNIADLKCLEELNFYGCYALETLPVDQLSGLDKLKRLDIRGCSKLRIDDILALKTISDLEIKADDEVILKLRNPTPPFLKTLQNWWSSL